MNDTITQLDLPLYVCMLMRTTQYIAPESPCTLESTLNQDIERLTLWFTANYLQVNATKTQAMTLGKSQYPYNLFIGDKSIEIEPTLKILGVTLDRDLSFKPQWQSC